MWTLLILALTISASGMTIHPRQLPAAVVGRAYVGGPLWATGGEGCPGNYVSLRVVGGKLPEGVELSAAGYFSGAPDKEGVYRFVLRSSNGCGGSEQGFAIEVRAAPVLEVTPEHVEVRHRMGTGTPAAVQLRVTSSSPGASYSVSAPAWPWLRLRLDAGVIEVLLEEGKLWPGNYLVPIRIEGWRLANRPLIRLQLEVRQAQLPVHAIALGGRPWPHTVPEIPTVVAARTYVEPPRAVAPAPQPVRGPRFGRDRFTPYGRPAATPIPVHR